MSQSESKLRFCYPFQVTIDQLKNHLRKNHNAEMPSTFQKVQNWDELQAEGNPEVKFEIADEDVIDLEHIDSSSSPPNGNSGRPLTGSDNVRREGKNFIILHSQKHNFDQNEDDKKFECPQCDYRYVQYFKVQRHFMTHTGERPYICKICTYDSITLESLKNHLKKNHQVELPAEHTYEPRTAQEQGQADIFQDFHFRWLESSVIKIGKSALIPLRFNHLK